MEQTVQINTYQNEEKGWGKREGMNILFPSYMNAKEMMENQTLLNEVAQYCANKISYALLTDANHFMKKYKDQYPIDTKQDAIYLPYTDQNGENKSALLSIFKNGQKFDILPYVQFNHVSHAGIVLTPGLYVDLYIKEQTLQKGLMGYTKDFSSMHFPVATEYLVQFCQLYKEILHLETYPEDFERFKEPYLLLLDEEVRQIKQRIEEEILRLTNRNRSKTIDHFVLDGQNLFKILDEYGVTSFISLRGVRLHNIAIKIGKKPEQIVAFVQKMQL